MSKTTVKKHEVISETVLWVVFVLAAGLGSLSLLNLIDLTSQAQAVIGYVLAAYTVLVFGYLTYKSVENK